MAQILILEDDQALVLSLRELLKPLAIKIFNTDSALRACALVDQYQFELAIVDQVLTVGSGTDLVNYLHQVSFQTKVLFLSQQNNLQQRLSSFQAGVDEYLAKPFSSAELLIKVKQLLHYYKLTDHGWNQYGSIGFDQQQGLVMIKNQQFYFRPQEAKLFALLLLNQETILSKTSIINLLWPTLERQPSLNTIEVYIRRLRRKLGSFAAIIATKKGFGYRLDLSRLAA